MRTILHVDMDAFYASVEVREDPSLRGKPVIVGGVGRRGVVCSATYEARARGVKSATPVAEALRRCPDAVVLPVRMHLYAEASSHVFRIFRDYTPLVEGLSLDEAFLDVTGSRSLFGSGATIARLIKDRIHSELGLIASAGVAQSKFVAKIASDLKKPDALVCVPDDVESFLAPLPIERMWGVGPKTAPRFRALSIKTFGDLAKADEEWLVKALGKGALEWAELARGKDNREVIPEHDPKSVGAERTYDRDIETVEGLRKRILENAERVASRLVNSQALGGVVVLKLKFADFTLQSRRRKLNAPAWDTTTIYETCRALLDEWKLPTPLRVRLVGVAVTDLEEEASNLALFTDRAQEKRKALMQILVDGKVKRGLSVTRADLLPTRE